MNLSVLSLIVLVVAIAIGFIRKVNVGILCMGFSLILILLYRLDSKEVISGFSGSLFVQMAGISYLFAIINGNGALKIVANKIAGLCGKRTWLIPFVIFILGYVLCAVGPGAIPTLVIIPVLAVPIAVSAGLNPLLVAVLGQMGVQAGRMSPITPEAAVVSNLMAEQGINGSTTTLGLCMLGNNIVMGIILYGFFKGWKTNTDFIAGEMKLNDTKTNTHQILSLLGLMLLVIGVLFFNMNAGLAGFLIGSVLVIIGAADEKKVLKDIPWGVVMMVLGVGVLMNIIQLSGGVDLLVAAMEKIMNAKTAAPFMSVVAAIMSCFSSGLGVVFPTLIPTAGGLAQSVGANALELVAAIVVGGTITGLSPVSSAGALVMAAISQEENSEQIYPQNKMFIQLLVIAVVDAVVLFGLTFAGVFGIIC